MTPETAKLHSQVKKVHRQSNGSVGARTVAIMAINNGYLLSRYRAGNIMKKLDLMSSSAEVAMLIFLFSTNSYAISLRSGAFTTFFPSLLG